MSSSFIEIQIQAIDQCHKQGKFSDSERSFLEEKWFEAQRKGGTEDDIFQTFDRMIGMKFGPGVGRIRQELQTMKSQILISAPVASIAPKAAPAPAPPKPQPQPQAPVPMQAPMMPPPQQSYLPPPQQQPLQPVPYGQSTHMYPPSQQHQMAPMHGFPPQPQPQSMYQPAAPPMYQSRTPPMSMPPQYPPGPVPQMPTPGQPPMQQMPAQMHGHTQSHSQSHSQSHQPPPQHQQQGVSHIQGDVMMDEAMLRVENNINFFSKLLDGMKGKGAISSQEYDKILQIKNDTLDPNLALSGQQRILEFEKQLKQSFGPKSAQLLEYIAFARKKWRTKLEEQQQQKAKAAAAAVFHEPTTAPTIPIGPIPGAQQSHTSDFDKKYPDQFPVLRDDMPHMVPPVVPAVKETKKKEPKKRATQAQQQAAAAAAAAANGGMGPGGVPMTALDELESTYGKGKAVTGPVPGDVLSELVKVNADGDEALRVVDRTLVFSEPLGDEESELELRAATRAGVAAKQLGPTPRIDLDTETDADLERAIALNLVNADVIARVARSARQACADFEVTSAAKRVLSDGIQMHLKNVVDAAFRMARSRLNRPAFESHATLMKTMSQCASTGDYEALKKCAALQWGPNVKEILRREETAAQEYVKKYTEMDEQRLVEKMKQYEEEIVKQTQSTGAAGTKRRVSQGVSDTDAWYNKETVADRDGLLSWEEIAESTIRSRLAKDHQLGLFRRRVTGKAAKAEAEAQPAASEPQQSQDASIPVDTAEPTGTQTAGSSAGVALTTMGQSLPQPLTFDEQAQFHTEALAKRSVQVSKEDLYTAISHANCLGNSLKAKQFVSYWKIK